MQTFNQNVLDSTEIRNLNNVHYELYQNSNAIVDESDMKICDDEKKEKDDENDDDDADNEELKYISEKEIDSKVWDLQNEVKKKEKEKKNDENESEENEIVE